MGQREGARGKSFFQKLLPLWKNLGTREAGDKGKLSLSHPLWCWLRALVRILQVSVKGIFSQIAVSLVPASLHPEGVLDFIQATLILWLKKPKLRNGTRQISVRDES